MQEAVSRRFVCGGEDFERDAPIQSKIARRVHDTHPASAQALFDPIVCEGAADERVGHSGLSMGPDRSRSGPAGILGPLPGAVNIGTRNGPVGR